MSRVLNGSPLVSEATRAKVQQVITDLGYRPSTLARALSRGRSATVAVIVPHFTRPSVVERLRGLADVLKESDYDLVLFDVENPEQREDRFESALRADRSAGMVVVSLAAEDSTVDRMVESGVPVVFLDRRVGRLPDVHVDDVAGGRLAVGHLLALGHRRIAFVGDDDANGFGFTSSRDRMSGYRQALEESGAAWDPDVVRLGPSSREAAHQLTAGLLETSNPPTAVFAASDLQAFGVVEAARQHGLAVPGDLSVMGFDDIDVAVYMGLTTIRQPLYESGRRAATMLLGMLADAAWAPESVELPVELVVRRTTAPPAGT